MTKKATMVNSCRKKSYDISIYGRKTHSASDPPCKAAYRYTPHTAGFEDRTISQVPPCALFILARKGVKNSRYQRQGEVHTVTQNHKSKKGGTSWQTH